jgi:hypothetical protein
MFAQLHSHLAQCVIDDRLRTQRHHAQRSLVEASLLAIGDRRHPRDHGRR